jgi:hypothetical protein
MRLLLGHRRSGRTCATTYFEDHRRRSAKPGGGVDRAERLRSGEPRFGAELWPQTRPGPLLGVGERGPAGAETGHSAVLMRRWLQVGKPVALRQHPLMVAHEVKRPPYLVQIDI